jgi:hypothetical protein
VIEPPLTVTITLRNTSSDLTVPVTSAGPARPSVGPGDLLAVLRQDVRGLIVVIRIVDRDFPRASDVRGLTASVTLPIARRLACAA